MTSFKLLKDEIKLGGREPFHSRWWLKNKALSALCAMLSMPTPLTRLSPSAEVLTWFDTQP